MIEVSLSEDDCEDGVRSAARLVHVGRCHRPASPSSSSAAAAVYLVVFYLSYTQCKDCKKNKGTVPTGFQPDCLHGLRTAQRFVLVFRYLFS